MAKVMEPGEVQGEVDLLFNLLGNLGGVIGLVINPWFLIFHWGWNFVFAVLIIYTCYQIGGRLGGILGRWIHG